MILATDWLKNAHGGADFDLNLGMKSRLLLK